MFNTNKVADNLKITGSKIGGYMPRLKHNVVATDVHYEPQYDTFQHGVHLGYDDKGKFTGVPQAWGEGLPQSEIAHRERPLPSVIAPSQHDVDFVRGSSPSTRPRTPQPAPLPSSSKITRSAPGSSTEKIKASWDLVAGNLGNLGTQLVGGALQDLGIKEESPEPKKADVDEIDWSEDPVATPEGKKKAVKDRLKKAQGNLALDLARLELSDMPEDATLLYNVHLSVVNLNLNYNQINRFPKSLPAFRLLQRLYLDGNQLDSFPPPIRNFVALRELTLNGNQLKKLPDEIGCLTLLEKLEVKNNQLEYLPDTIGLLVKLEELHLSGNAPLTTLPRSIGWCNKIEVMDVSQCGLTSLPDTFGCIARLMEVDLSTNQLTTLPDSVGLLNRLCVLNVSDNRLKDLPVSLGLLYGLQSCYFDGNPDLDEEFYGRAHRGMTHLLDYLEKRMNEHVDVVDEYTEEIRPILPKVSPPQNKNLLDDDVNGSGLSSPLLSAKSPAPSQKKGGSGVKIAPRGSSLKQAQPLEEGQLLSFEEPAEDLQVAKEVQAKVDKLRQLAEGMKSGLNGLIRDMKIELTKVESVTGGIPIAQRITKLKNELNDIKPKVEQYSKVWKQTPPVQAGEDKLIVLKRTISIALDNLSTAVDALLAAINRTDDLRLLFIYLKHLKALSTLLQE